MRVARPSQVAKPLTARGGLRPGTASAPRKRGASSNGRKRGGVSVADAAEKAEAATSAMYDSSDSFENHVIDLRGDEYRSANGRDEDDQTLKDLQSSQDASVDNGNGCGESYSDIDASQLSIGRPLSDGTTTKHSNSTQQDESAEEGTDGSPSNILEHQFVPGQLTWAKLARFPWWPAQVMAEREAKEGTGGTPASDTDLLVRFFGTYDYGWVDPFMNLSSFEQKLAERSRVRKKALQKGVEEALLFQSSGRLPERWQPVARTRKYESQNVHCNGVTVSAKESKGSPVNFEGPKEVKYPRKRKPKVLYEEEGRVERKPQRILRRIRVMRQLGLVAPAGSPFTMDYN